MRFRPNLKFAVMLIGVIVLPLCVNDAVSADDFTNNAAAKSRRVTPLVKAVQECQNSVVNLRGRKSVPDPNDASAKRLKQVNGMGTGIVINSAGYILTNYHVVEGVKVIEVTTSNREQTTAKLMAHDPETDLAILKIETKEPLPPIKTGSSSDLMLGEKVSALGNAYGYEHTLTLGIVSALNRTVQVNDDQIYRNLIQTDTAINPGNSGGPLMNVNGEMIGIVVAVRIGAQGIAFAIPVNDAMEIASELMSKILPNSAYHGMSLRTEYVQDRPRLVVDSVSPESPAAAVGLTRGDQIEMVNGKRIKNKLDFQSSLLTTASNPSLRLGVVQANKTNNVVLNLEKRTAVPQPSSIAWDAIGVMLTPISKSEMANRHPNYKRGLTVTKVKPNSPADAEGIMPGDVVVAMHGWKTESLENMAYILQQSEIKDRKDFMFYILRDTEPLWGQMRVAELPKR